MASVSVAETWAIDAPSGLQAGAWSGPGLRVTRDRVWPRSGLSAETSQMSVL